MFTVWERCRFWLEDAWDCFLGLLNFLWEFMLFLREEPKARWSLACLALTIGVLGGWAAFMLWSLFHLEEFMRIGDHQINFIVAVVNHYDSLGITWAVLTAAIVVAFGFWIRPRKSNIDLHDMHDVWIFRLLISGLAPALLLALPLGLENYPHTTLIWDKFFGLPPITRSYLALGELLWLTAMMLTILSYMAYTVILAIRQKKQPRPN